MKSNKIKLYNTVYHYLEWENPGKPKILLLHGLKVESHCWDEVAGYLQNDFHVYALDLKGHGESEHGTSHEKDYSFEQIGKEIKEFGDKVLQDPFHIAGYSLGGQYAMNYAATYPHTLKSLILIDTAPDVSLKGIFFLLVLGLAKNKTYASKEEVVKLAEKHGLGKIGRYMADHTMKQNASGRFDYKFDQNNIAPKKMKDYKKRVKQLWENLRAVQAKTLFIKAEKSQIISQSLVKKVKKALPGIIVEIMPKVGHEMVFMAPKETAEKIIRFAK